MDDVWFKIMLTFLTTLAASSGFWAYMMKRFESRSATTRMILGLGHDRICYLAMRYIKKGYITNDEYENLYNYLYKPYLEMGGNGCVERLVHEVNKLPIKHVAMEYSCEDHKEGQKTV